MALSRGIQNEGHGLWVGMLGEDRGKDVPMNKVLEQRLEHRLAYSAISVSGPKLGLRIHYEFQCWPRGKTWSVMVVRHALAWQCV